MISAVKFFNLIFASVIHYVWSDFIQSQSHNLFAKCFPPKKNVTKCKNWYSRVKTIVWMCVWSHVLPFKLLNIILICILNGSALNFWFLFGCKLSFVESFTLRTLWRTTASESTVTVQQHTCYVRLFSFFAHKCLWNFEFLMFMMRFMALKGYRFPVRKNLKKMWEI